MNCLILNPATQIDLSHLKDTIINLLSKLGIINNLIINDIEDYYLAGDNYLQYISFLGCSPYLNFDVQKNIKLSDLKETIADLNYIQFHFNSNSYSFNKTEFAIKAICPACKTKITEWNSLISAWEKENILNLPCPTCNEIISIIDINWKKTAGFYKSAILFHGIQAELALPTDALLIQLEKYTKVKWQYFYG